jgi:hypothetical protein
MSSVSSSVSVRYTVKGGRGDENQALIEQVFAELSREAPAGLRYSAFRAEDGVTFLHVVSHDAGDAGDVLRSLPAFRAFRAGLDERCVAPPARTPLTEIGAYGFAEAAIGAKR